MSYRGIALAPTMYKMYSSILNERIMKGTESSGLIVDEQNGFRKKRSTVDHISSLTNIIDTRKKNNLHFVHSSIFLKRSTLLIDLFFGVS